MHHANNIKIIGKHKALRCSTELHHLATRQFTHVDKGTVHTQTKYKTHSVPGTAAGLLDQHRHGETLIQYTQLAVALLQIVRV